MKYAVAGADSFVEAGFKPAHGAPSSAPTVGTIGFAVIASTRRVV